MGWTEERVERLKQLWMEGLSASQIAAELGGVTRNAVIGKVHRLGLSGRAKPARSSAPRARKPRQARPRGEPRYVSVGNTALKADPLLDYDLEPEPAVITELIIPPAERKSIMQLNEQTCKWPIGDPTEEDFHFCGRHSPVGTPYCEHHARIAYQPLNERRRERRQAARIRAAG